MKCARWRTFFQSCDDLKDLPFSFSFVFFFQSPFFFFFFPLDDISLFISFILFIVRQSSGGQKFNIASIKLLIPVVSFKKKKITSKFFFFLFFRHSLFRRLSARSLPSAGNRSKFPFDAYRLDPTFMNGQIDMRDSQSAQVFVYTSQLSALPFCLSSLTPPQINTLANFLIMKTSSQRVIC